MRKQNALLDLINRSSIINAESLAKKKNMVIKESGLNVNSSLTSGASVAPSLPGTLPITHSSFASNTKLTSGLASANLTNVAQPPPSHNLFGYQSSNLTTTGFGNSGVGSNELMFGKLNSNNAPPPPPPPPSSLSSATTFSSATSKQQPQLISSHSSLPQMPSRPLAGSAAPTSAANSTAASAALTGKRPNLNMPSTHQTPQGLQPGQQLSQQSPHLSLTVSQPHQSQSTQSQAQSQSQMVSESKWLVNQTRCLYFFCLC